MGYTGQISVGHGAFMSVGAYTAANVAVRFGMPFWVALPAGGLVAALVGAIVGIPALRIKGLYLAIATLAAQLIIEWLINHVRWISGGVQASIEVPRPELFGFVIDTQTEMYFFLLVFVVLAVVGTMNLVRSRVGRAFIAIRDQDIAAEIIGINIFRYKLIAFAISSFYAGVTGVLYTHYLGIANYEQFQIDVSINHPAIIFIGGLGSVLGSVLGAIFVTLPPILIRWTMGAVRSASWRCRPGNACVPAPRLPRVASAVQAPAAEPTPRRARFGGQVVIEREQLVVQVGVAQQGVAHWGPPSSGQTKEGTPFTDLLSSSVRGSHVSPQ